MTYSEIIADRIDALLKQRGITLNKLARLSGLHQSTLFNFYNGSSTNPKIHTLVMIANALGMTVSEFLDFDELNSFNPEDEN